jgi:hypothetical protein
LQADDPHDPGDASVVDAFTGAAESVGDRWGIPLPPNTLATLICPSGVGAVPLICARRKRRRQTGDDQGDGRRHG